MQGGEFYSEFVELVFKSWFSIVNGISSLIYFFVTPLDVLLPSLGVVQSILNTHVPLVGEVFQALINLVIYVFGQYRIIDLFTITGIVALFIISTLNMLRKTFF